MKAGVKKKKKKKQFLEKQKNKLLSNEILRESKFENIRADGEQKQRTRAAKTEASV